ncbi:MAG: hypothetical protein PHT49_05165 [Desulfovibrionales bacterium]|nr:hypothetical protein [Desulfovibrionales bacterium]
MNEKGKKKNELTLTVKVRLEQAKGKELPEVVVYAFDQTGQFLTAAKLPKGEQAEVRLDLPIGLRGTTVRAILGPPLAAEDEDVPSWMAILMRRGKEQKEVPSSAVLVQRGAYEKRARMHTEHEVLSVAVFPHDWTKWLRCLCTVQGRVVKRMALPDGTTKDLGVCHACVKIYEVDKFPKLIARLPERDLFRLRDDLWRRFRQWPPEELPFEYKPRVWPSPPPPPPERTQMSGISSLEAVSAVAINPQPEPPIEALGKGTVITPINSQIQTELEPILLAVSATELRSALVAKADILVRFACLWEWLYSYFHTDLIKCACTDEQGRFQTTVSYPCGGDKPDLYFKVMQCIDGALHTLYDPGVACHTYWNYECGSEVTLEVTDPAARVCVPTDPVEVPAGVSLWVMPYAVGGISLDRIKPNWQKNLTWHVADPDPTKRGLTDYGSIVDAPFGGWLGFRHGYASSIPTPALYYYRWRYKKEGEAEWHDFSEPVVRHYVKEMPGKLPTFPVCTLGPKGVDGKNLYRFKPHDPSECGDFIPGGTNYWPTDDWFGDIYTGFLNSPGLPGGVDTSAGKYKIKLEVYDQAGNRVTSGPGTFQFIVPTGVADDGVTIETRLADAAEIESDGFVFYLHIDNRKCTAIIDAPTIGGVSAGDVCGFLRYTPGDSTPVHIAFHAVHTANFATFSFSVTRGATPVSNVGGEVAAGSVADKTTAPSDHSYTGDGNGNFQHDFPTGRLLGPCAEAAFAEVLNVDAKATNGWRRLDEYDADAVRAFALAPETGDET